MAVRTGIDRRVFLWTAIIAIGLGVFLLILYDRKSEDIIVEMQGCFHNELSDQLKIEGNGIYVNGRFASKFNVRRNNIGLMAEFLDSLSVRYDSSIGKYIFESNYKDTRIMVVNDNFDSLSLFDRNGDEIVFNRVNCR